MGRRVQGPPRSERPGGSEEGTAPIDDKRSRFDRLPQAWPLTVSPAAYTVLGCLAHHRNNRTGRCNPSLARMAKFTGLSTRTVRRALAELERVGRISRAPNRGSTSSYRLDFTPATYDTPATSVRPTPDTHGRGPRTPVSAEQDCRNKKDLLNHTLPPPSQPKNKKPTATDTTAVSEALERDPTAEGAVGLTAQDYREAWEGLDLIVAEPPPRPVGPLATPGKDLSGWRGGTTSNRALATVSRLSDGLVGHVEGEDRRQVAGRAKRRTGRCANRRLARSGSDHQDTTNRRRDSASDEAPEQPWRSEGWPRSGGEPQL